MHVVHGTARSRALRVMWMLEELGLPWDHVPSAPRSEAILSINPTGKIPALVVGDVTLTDSVAIVQFLADRAQLLTHRAGTVERAVQDGFTQFCVDEVEGALWTAGKHSFVLPEALRTPQVKEAARWEFARALETLEARLGDRPFVMGEDFTVPDLLLGHCAGWAVAAKFALPHGPLGAYFERLRARPALRRAMEKAKG